MWNMPLQGVITDVHNDLGSKIISITRICSGLRFFKPSLAYTFPAFDLALLYIADFFIKLKVRLSGKLSGYIRLLGEISNLSF